MPGRLVRARAPLPRPAGSPAWLSVPCGAAWSPGVGTAGHCARAPDGAREGSEQRGVEIGGGKSGGLSGLSKLRDNPIAGVMGEKPASPHWTDQITSFVHPTVNGFRATWCNLAMKNPAAFGLWRLD